MDDIKIVFKAIIGDVVEGAKKVLSVFKNTKSSIESNPIRINTEEDFKSAENSLKKLKIALLKKEVKHCENSIKNYEEYIEKCNKAKKDEK